MKDSITTLYDKIQHTLDGLQETDETFMFLAKNGHRAVIAGDDEDLSVLVLFNMIKYDVVSVIFKRAVSLFNKMTDEQKEIVRQLKPRYEQFLIDGKNQSK